MTYNVNLKYYQFKLPVFPSLYGRGGLKIPFFGGTTKHFMIPKYLLQTSYVNSSSTFVIILKFP